MVDSKKTKIRKALDAVRERVFDSITQYGWAIMNIHGAENVPGYSYTVGMTEKGLPEVIMFGIPPNIALPVLNSVAQQLVDGLVYGENIPLTKVFEGMQAYLKPVSQSVAREHMRLASELYEEGLSGLQLVWPDEAGHFPWQDGFNESLRAAQPLLFHRDLH